MEKTPNGSQQEPKEGPKISAASMSAKYNSKRDIYYFMTVDVGAYLPNIESVTIYFLKDLICAKKLYVKCNQVSYIFVPQYENLTLKEIGQFINQNMQAMSYFPETKEVLKFPKQWIVNVLSSVIGEKFRQWVRDRIEQRNEKIAVDKDINIDIDPVILEIFNKSTNHSTSKGIGANLLKTGSKRRRTFAEIREQKEAAQRKEDEINQKLSQFDNLQRELNNLRAQQSQNMQNVTNPQRHVDGNRLQLKGSDYLVNSGTVSKQRAHPSDMQQ